MKTGKCKSKETPEKTDTYYNQLKMEADKEFGVKEFMTVEEYFGKLRYMVNAYYDSIQNQSEGRNHY